VQTYTLYQYQRQPHNNNCVEYYLKGNAQRKFYRPQSATIIGLVWSTIFQAFGQERVSITLTKRQILLGNEVGSNRKLLERK
jgi:hypothetical protein